MTYDPHTVAVVMVTGAVTWAAITVTAGLAIITARTVEHHQRNRRARSTR